MNQYCIYLEPELKELNQIQSFRKRYDPLAEMIPPHVTLVFPFESSERESLLNHLNQILNKAHTITFTLGEPEIHMDYVWFPIVEGSRDVHLLHKKLYTGFLKTFLSTSHEYHPHITLGRFNDDKTGKQILKEAQLLNRIDVGIFKKAILEVIGDNNFGDVVKIWEFS